MADSDVIQKIDPNASQGDIIKTLNDNFETLTKRIKNNNITLSFLDLLRLDKVWSWTDGLNGSTDTQRLQNFISTVWNTLANYSGVYIQCTLAQGSSVDYAFKFHGKEVFNSDYLVKLPGSEFVYIKGQPANYYVPVDYNYTTGSVTYQLQASEVGAIDNIPQAAQSGYQVTNYAVYVGEDIPLSSNSIISIRWFTWDESEEIFWNGSHKDIHNQTTRALHAIVCHTS